MEPFLFISLSNFLNQIEYAGACARVYQTGCISRQKNSKRTKRNLVFFLQNKWVFFLFEMNVLN